MVIQGFANPANEVSRRERFLDETTKPTLEHLW
jgi:hypothetical protein